MSSAVAGYKQSLGADAPPCAYEDIDAADLILIAGSNTAFAHPVVYRRIEDARAKNPALKVVVIDPRATVTARAADLHLALKPGTDVALFNAMLHVLRTRRAACDFDSSNAHTEGFDALERAARLLDPGARSDGLRPAGRAASSRRRACSAAPKAALSLYCQGLNQSASGTFKNSRADQPAPRHRPDRPRRRGAVLAHRPAQRHGRARGRRHGEPAFGVTGTSATQKHRAEVAALWGVRSVPERPGKTAVEMFEAIGRGEIKAVWIACTNPAQSMPDATRCARRSSAPSSSSCRRPSATPRPARTPTCCCRRRAGRRRKAPSPTPSGASRACALPCRRRARRARTGRSRWTSRGELFSGEGRDCFPYRDAGGDLQRAPRNHARPRPRHHRPLLRAARARRPAAVALPGGRDGRPHAPLRRRRLPDALGPRALRRHRVRAAGRGARRRTTRCGSPPGACATSGTA